MNLEEQLFEAEDDFYEAKNHLQKIERRLGRMSKSDPRRPAKIKEKEEAIEIVRKTRARVKDINREINSGGPKEVRIPAKVLSQLYDHLTCEVSDLEDPPPAEVTAFLEAWENG